MRKIKARAARHTEDRDGKRCIELVLHHNEAQSTVVGLTEDEGRATMRELGKMLRAPHAGRSLLEILWEELDAIMERLMTEGQPHTPVEDEFYQQDLDAWREWGEERGKAQGVAYAIAVITNPYEVSVQAIKREAARRWETKNAGE